MYGSAFVPDKGEPVLNLASRFQSPGRSGSRRCERAGSITSEIEGAPQVSFISQPDAVAGSIISAHNMVSTEMNGLRQSANWGGLALSARPRRGGSPADGMGRRVGRVLGPEPARQDVARRVWEQGRATIFRASRQPISPSRRRPGERAL